MLLFQGEALRVFIGQFPVVSSFFWSELFPSFGDEFPHPTEQVAVKLESPCGLLLEHFDALFTKEDVVGC